MQQIIRFQAKDGTVFNKEEDCVKYEKVIKEVDKIMKGIGEEVKDENCEFANGKGYIQHNKKVVKKAQEDIVSLAIKELKLEDKSWKFGSFIGRYIDDSGVNCIKSAYSRLSCIDIKGREWGTTVFCI